MGSGPAPTACSPDRHLLERFVEDAFLTPVDAAIRRVQELPAAVERAQQQLVLARFVGKLAVHQGVREVRRRLDGLEARPATAPPARAPSPRHRTRTDRIRPRRADAPTDPAPGGADGGAPQADDLALPDYEQLPAAHIVAKLAGLQQSERDAIEAFELANRHRRTILGKLDQLRAP